MTLNELYTAVDSDYDDVIRRLGGEQRVNKYLFKFADDDSFAVLQEALLKKEAEKAFRAAHTLKGIALNLGLKELAVPASALTECLRDKTELPDTAALYEKLSEAYFKIVNLTKKLRVNNSK